MLKLVSQRDDSEYLQHSTVYFAVLDDEYR